MSHVTGERIIFTKEMKKEYTLLIPMMLPIHFKMLCSTFELHGYNVDLLETTHENIVNEGLRSVHNDSCYPALLVIGQLLDAVKSGKYDNDKIALLITQTGGGCRASNYITLLRKALKQNNLEHIPVVSLNFAGLEKNPGFKLSLEMMAQLVYSVVYGDMLTWLSNQCRPYEINKNETDELIEKWEEKLAIDFKNKLNIRPKKVIKNLSLIVKDFAKIKLRDEKRIKVGIVGEIYVKYAPLGNNNLEAFLANEGCEVVVPGLLDFILYTLEAGIDDVEIYGGNKFGKFIRKLFKKFFINIQNEMKKSILENSNFRPVVMFDDLKLLLKNGEYVSRGNKMGEGWLLTAEMLDLCHMGVNNIVCTQPFGCLPNHIAGKGMIRRIKENNEDANIVAIDYDPGATKVNQENRIKLMLANAK